MPAGRNGNDAVNGCVFNCAVSNNKLMLTYRVGELFVHLEKLLKTSHWSIQYHPTTFLVESQT